VRNYTANGTLPLHESVIFADSGQAAFVYLDCNDDYKLKTANYIERPDKILYPADNMDSQNPPPYVFASVEELKMYLESAKRESFDSLYQQVNSALRKYVNIDELPCIYCGFSDCIEFDLSLHYLEKHRQNLIRLRIGKSSIDDRADYAVELSKKKLFEFLDENEDDDNEDVEDESDD
jgi:hypothetical protein